MLVYFRYSYYTCTTGTCLSVGDAIRGAYSGIDQNGFGFSTIDRDNDGCSPCLFGDIAENSCASSSGGGWWYSSCGSASLHGDWHPHGDHNGWASALYWQTWKYPGLYSLNATRMMIKQEDISTLYGVIAPISTVHRAPSSRRRTKKQNNSNNQQQHTVHI